MSAARITMPATSRERDAGVRRWLRLVLIEVRFSYAWLFMPLVVIASVWFFNAWLWQPDRYWDVVSSNIAQSFLLIGPAGAMWSAFVAGREDRSRMHDLTTSMPVNSLSRQLLVSGTPVIGSVLSYGLGAAIIMSWYGRQMTWGSPDWPLIGYGTLAVLMCAVVGIAFGQVMPGRFSPVIVSGSLFLYFVMSYSISNMGDSLRGWALLAYPRDGLDFRSPLTTYPDSLHADEPPLLAGVLICGAVIAVALAALIGYHGRWRYALPFAVIAVIAFASATPMTTITAEDRATAISALREGPEPVENPPLVCAGDMVTTCLHQIDQRDLSDVSAAVDSLLAPVQGLGSVPERIEMRADIQSEPGVLRMPLAGYDITPRHFISMIVPLIFGETDEDLTKPEQVILVWMLWPVETVDIDDILFISPPGVLTGDVAPSVMAAWRAEIQREAERFGSLPRNEQRAWLEANWDALRTGELTLEDLP